MASKTVRIKHHFKLFGQAIHKHTKDHFIPHEGNGHVPHVLKHHVLLGYSAILILLKALVVAVSIALPYSIVFSSSITPQNIIDLTNQSRAELGLSQLQANSKLARAAQAKAQDMLDKQYFSHISPDGTKPWAWIKKAGYVYTAAAENLAAHFTEAEKVESSWLASPEHRTIITSPKYTEVGVGVIEGIFQGYPSVLVVEMFGRPSAEEAAEAKTTHAAPNTDMSLNKGTSTSTNKTIVFSGSTEGVVAGLSVDQSNSVGPVIDQTKAKVIPGSKNVAIALPIRDAAFASATLGGKHVAMQPTKDPEVWSGSIAIDQDKLPSSGETLSVIALDKSGRKTQAALALIAPHEVQKVYAPGSTNESDCPFLNIGRITDIAKNSKCIYIFVISSLTLVLALFMIAGHMKKPLVIAHTLVVICLAIVLLRL